VPATPTSPPPDVTTDPSAHRTGDDEADSVIEPKLDDAFSRIVEEGEARLGRDWLEMASTGVMAGLEVGIGILVMLTVLQRTGDDKLLGGLAFSFGFLALLLGHSELFTEGFLIPITTLAAKRARARQVIRLWAVTLVTNLAGGWFVALLAIKGFPELAGTADSAASQFVSAGTGVRSLCLAVLAGAVITLMTRMQHGTDSEPAKIFAAVASATVLAGLPLFHSILDSIVMFTALQTGHAPFGYVDWLRFFGWTVLWNVVGGVGLVTILRLVRSRKRVAQDRQQAER
jgi:formate/nitrite transporter FocA (FNT family)